MGGERMDLRGRLTGGGLVKGVPLRNGREVRGAGRVWDTRGSENDTEGVRELDDREVIEPSTGEVTEGSRDIGGASVSVSE